jgi:hypothetical protein
MTKRRNIRQLAMFAEASEIAPIIGLRVELWRSRDVDCKCGSRVGIIHEGTGPHKAAILCSYCGKFRDWMKQDTIDTIMKAVATFGRMAPILIKDLSPEFSTENDAAPLGNAASPPRPIVINEGLKMRVSEIYPNKYLKAIDLAGRDHKVIIDKVTREKIGDDEKPVVTYRGWEKTHPINKGVASTLAEILGDETGTWAGKTVILFSTVVPFNGKQFNVVRARHLTARDAKLPISTSMPPPVEEDEAPDE